MPRGILHVETRPAAPEQVAEYHKWYNEVHLPEILAVEGFVSARRFAPLGPDDPFLAIYEIDAADLDAVQARLAEAFKTGKMSPTVGVQVDPPGTFRFYREIVATAP